MQSIKALSIFTDDFAVFRALETEERRQKQTILSDVRDGDDETDDAYDGRLTNKHVFYG